MSEKKIEYAVQSSKTNIKIKYTDGSTNSIIGELIQYTPDGLQYKTNTGTIYYKPVKGSTKQIGRA